MLGKLSTDYAQYQPRIQLVFRDPNTIYYIPNYEGISTLK